ncbi:pH signal transduction protein [Salix suchowensis]|nr:pH signal transduction protein [Salix suchowensis]
MFTKSTATTLAIALVALNAASGVLLSQFRDRTPKPARRLLPPLRSSRSPRRTTHLLRTTIPQEQHPPKNNPPKNNPPKNSPPKNSPPKNNPPKAEPPKKPDNSKPVPPKTPLNRTTVPGSAPVNDFDVDYDSNQYTNYYINSPYSWYPPTPDHGNENGHDENGAGAWNPWSQWGGGFPSYGNPYQNYGGNEGGALLRTSLRSLSNKSLINHQRSSSRSSQRSSSQRSSSRTNQRSRPPTPKKGKREEDMEERDRLYGRGDIDEELEAREFWADLDAREFDELNEREVEMEDLYAREEAELEEREYYGDYLESRDLGYDFLDALD